MRQGGHEIPKAPRWIRTEAGQWAWQRHDDWRSNAARAMSVADRSELLREAELLQRSQEPAG